MCRYCGHGLALNEFRNYRVHVSQFFGILADQRSWQQMGRYVSSLTAFMTHFQIARDEGSQ